MGAGQSLMLIIGMELMDDMNKIPFSGWTQWTVKPPVDTMDNSLFD